ncbi:MAG TPA: Ku protein [Solirubrobacteraceae bacterium]|jgi:DNA end-binding protein Ku
MPRPIWSGSICFGLVNVPVKLYSATSSKSVRFHQLHAADHVRVRQKRVCPVNGEEVAFADIVKGYEVTPGHYVVVEPEELAALAPNRTNTIAIEDFVELSEIDPIYYDRPYYLVPGLRGTKPYRLLLEAMRETEKIGVARVILRSRERLVSIRPTREVLVMTTMSFADEVLEPDRVKGQMADEQISERELDVACRLVESLAAPFDPSKYHDSYRESLLDLIERKTRGQEEPVVVAPAANEDVRPADLMNALLASLASGKPRNGGRAQHTPSPTHALV